MGVFPPKSNALADLFGRPKALIGVIHSHAIPGAPQHDGRPFEQVVEFAIAEGRRYRDGGFDALIVENAWDLPFAKPEDLRFETSAGMAVLTDHVRREVGLPVGVNVLANGVECALASAIVGGAGFVRVNQWANAYVANEGFVEGRAAAATRYRSQLQADHVKVFADVHVKHGSHAIVADRTVAEQASDAEWFDADVLIATGQRTGGATDIEEIERIRAGTQLPVIVGSGVNEDNAEATFRAADGAIVASWAKQDGVWWNPVDPKRVERLTQIAEGLW